ncbi:DEAD/DEAH box helicase [Nocardioides sp. TF02-7]|nr:DEAD/DEAH box helicase [Nocardioides sp. TF02-7]UMG94872.1 DEAD/DEAH box helicase [Nocardioides sp. TF02-7]
MPDVRTKFQVVALLAREERNRVKADESLSDAKRSEELKRLDGIATILAQTAARDSTLFELLSEEAEISHSAEELRRELLKRAGIDEPEPEPEPVVLTAPSANERRVPPSVVARQLANPFLVPDFEAAAQVRRTNGRLATWELLGPLFRSFEDTTPGAPVCMDLPDPLPVMLPPGRELMAHQARMVAAAAEGHRTFLLADEPGLGKTAQALLAAQAADAYPLLVAVPNVVKTNWAREVELWTPSRRATVLHGDAYDVDGFADVFVVNYEILDRHVGWLGQHGFRGMIVDEAHYIKNKTSQRSQNVLELADRIRKRVPRPLLMALTGTPLINDIEDFRAIWQFLGWIDDKKPLGELMAELEDTGLTPADRAFYPAARQCVVDMGIVRRRKVDVAADIPARRIADVPVELEGEAGRSIRKAEEDLARRLVQRYDRALETRRTQTFVDGIDHDLVRQVATWEREDISSESGENVFAMLRRIGQAKAGLAADYAAQLARSAGKVVFFAKHIDVMDTAEETFAARGIKAVSIRGDQTKTARQQAIDSFTEDPEVQVIVCSLTAAGVGINLQVASNLVLAELSWTDAEQTQAIDRVHRIGQTEPVTAWRVIATQTIDTRVAELIDSKAGLAARALDAQVEEGDGGFDLQLEALVGLLTQALERREATKVFT